MNLRTLAEQDLAITLEDSVMGFGWPISVTDPDGLVGVMDGSSDDISQVIDPDTGTVVSGRTASVVLRISTLASKGLGLPVSIADSADKPWIIEFLDINGFSFKFKVQQSNPDRMLGIVSCLLEFYE